MSPDQVPAPPDKPPDDLPEPVARAVPKLWRLHWEEDVTKPDVKIPGRWRFDAPNGEYPVSYANVSEDHVFVEVYGDFDGPGEIAPTQADRRLSSLTLTRHLKIVDLGDAEVMRALGCDLRVAADMDYPRTQLWSLCIHHWWPAADAISYPGRKSGNKENYCLFLDRCGTAIEQTFHGTIAENEARVLRACDKFKLLARVYFEKRSISAWS